MTSQPSLSAWDASAGAGIGSNPFAAADGAGIGSNPFAAADGLGIGSNPFAPAPAPEDRPPPAKPAHGERKRKSAEPDDTAAREARAKAKEREEKEKKKKLEAIPESRDAGNFTKLGEFLCPYSFDNALPDVPCDPKLLVHQFDKAAFVRYQYDSSLEMTHKYELLAEPDLGISIDLVDPAAYDPVGDIAEQSRAEPSRAEQSRAEHSKES